MNISKRVYADVMEFLAEELYSSWHAEEDSSVHENQYFGGVEVLSIVTGFRLTDIEAEAWNLARQLAQERCEEVHIPDSWPTEYQQAIHLLARWKFEAVNSELTEPHRYKRYSDRYVIGRDMVKILTQKPYTEINYDISLVYNKVYCSAIREGREQWVD